MAKSFNELVDTFDSIAYFKADMWFRPAAVSPGLHPRHFDSIQRAITIEEAWDKTFKKWQLMMEGLKSYYYRSTCGLCDLYNKWNVPSGMQCVKCPVYIVTGHTCCEDTPCGTRDSSPELEYLFLLFVKKATEDGAL